MNANKAREYFSEYYEKELSGALLESFERVLKQDAQVQAEYRAFSETMEGLAVLSSPVPEPEFDLHERISQRLDRHVFELNQQPKGSFWQSWRNLAFGGIAALAIVGAVASLTMRGNSGSASAGVGPVGQTRVKKPIVDLKGVDLKLDNGRWTFEYNVVGQDLVKILDEKGTEQVHQVLQNGALKSPLTNNGLNATLIRVQFESASNPLLIAIPGSASGGDAAELNGSGSLSDLAIAASEAFNRPVIVATQGRSNSVEWKLDRNDQVSSINSAVQAMSYTVEASESGAIWIR